MEMEMEELKWKKKGRMLQMESRYKTEVCRRFMAGSCGDGSKCRYAHGVSELRVRGGCPKVCRMFSLYRNCSYGHKCRFLHHLHHPQPPPEYTPMQTETTSFTNASSSTLVETNANEQAPETQRVKFIFKDHQLQKISRIYADWI